MYWSVLCFIAFLYCIVFLKLQHCHHRSCYHPVASTPLFPAVFLNLHFIVFLHLYLYLYLHLYLYFISPLVFLKLQQHHWPCSHPIWSLPLFAAVFLHLYLYFIVFLHLYIYVFDCISIFVFVFVFVCDHLYFLSCHWPCSHSIAPHPLFAAVFLHLYLYFIVFLHLYFFICILLYFYIFISSLHLYFLSCKYSAIDLAPTQLHLTHYLLLTMCSRLLNLIELYCIFLLYITVFSMYTTVFSMNYMYF